MTRSSAGDPVLQGQDRLAGQHLQVEGDLAACCRVTWIGMVARRPAAAGPSPARWCPPARRSRPGRGPTSTSPGPAAARRRGSAAPRAGTGRGRGPGPGPCSSAAPARARGRSVRLVTVTTISPSPSFGTLGSTVTATWRRSWSGGGASDSGGSGVAVGSTEVLGWAEARSPAWSTAGRMRKVTRSGLALGLARQPATTSASSAGATARRGSGTRLAAQLGQAMLDGEGGGLGT